MLVEAHPASVPFSTLVQIFGCMLETVHPRAALVRIACCMLERVHPALLRLECTCRYTWGWGAGLSLSNEVGVHEKPRDVVANKFVQTVFCFHFRRSGIEGDAVSKESRYGGAAPVSYDKPEGLFMILRAPVEPFLHSGTARVPSGF